MPSLLTDEHRSWIGKAEPPVEVEVSRRDIVKYSIATEQLQEKYLSGDEAPPMFVFNLFAPLRRMPDIRPDGLSRGTAGPSLPLKRVMAGGTELKLHRPIRPGDRLVGTQRITGMAEKQGSTGPLIFTERTLEVKSADGEPVFDEIQTAIAR
ncbi:MAG: MaoC family dehydratase N-terminal domain-containing protein [Gammaproteobacteria bacterium]|nr:MaoC family dehydratase N-terminal domain-containing protein [Gammaproteobacteria bacterium]